MQALLQARVLLDDLTRGSCALDGLVNRCLHFIFCQALQQKGTDEWQVPTHAVVLCLEAFPGLSFA